MMYLAIAVFLLVAVVWLKNFLRKYGKRPPEILIDLVWGTIVLMLVLPGWSTTGSVWKVLSLFPIGFFYGAAIMEFIAYLRERKNKCTENKNLIEPEKKPC